MSVLYFLNFNNILRLAQYIQSIIIFQCNPYNIISELFYICHMYWVLEVWLILLRIWILKFCLILINLNLETDTQVSYWKTFKYMWNCLGMWISFFNYKFYILNTGKYFHWKFSIHIEMCYKGKSTLDFEDFDKNIVL